MSNVGVRRARPTMNPLHTGRPVQMDELWSFVDDLGNALPRALPIIHCDLEVPVLVAPRAANPSAQFQQKLVFELASPTPPPYVAHAHVSLASALLPKL